MRNFSKRGSSKRAAKRNTSPDKSYAYYKEMRHKPNVKPIEVSVKEDGRLRLVPSFIAALIILGSLIFALTISTTPNIEIIQDNSPYRNIQEYQDAASTILKNNIGSHTKLTVDTNEVEQEMLNTFPEINGAVLRLPVLGRNPSLAISVRQPKILLSNNSNLYVLDSTGRSVAYAKDLNAESLGGLKTIVDSSNVEIGTGQQVVTSELVEFIDAVELQLKEKNIAIKNIVLPNSANEVHLYIEGQEYFIKMDVGSSARLQSGGYIAVKEKLAREGFTPSEYIDVRVEEKVFYK